MCFIILLCGGSCVVLTSLMSFCLHVGADTLGMKATCAMLCGHGGFVGLPYVVGTPSCSLVSEPVDVWEFAV